MNYIQAALRTGFVNQVDVVGINYLNRVWNKDLTLYSDVHRKYPHLKLLGSETQSTVSSIGVYKLPVDRVFNPWYSDYQVSYEDT